ncbi:MAG TPA: hypothetical protein PK926_08925 [Spirochaetota bacterium]|nr:hypothetical protein [Spirochaetota bacterium]HPI88587.1 hypothetical protein [Spirochaetota bacterium]HPR48228.1 hypothetical protein [Spirochaetota bacterium]
MSIKPIDLQTNIGQMHEVGKGEHSRMGAIAEQQHLLEKESNDKSKLVNTRLDESQKGEKTAIRDEEKKREQKMNQGRDNQGDSKKEKDNVNVLKDDRMGNIIDVLK